LQACIEACFILATEFSQAPYPLFKSTVSAGNFPHTFWIKTVTGPFLPLPRQLRLRHRPLHRREILLVPPRLGISPPFLVANKALPLFFFSPALEGPTTSASQVALVAWFSPSQKPFGPVSALPTLPSWALKPLTESHLFFSRIFLPPDGDGGSSFARDRWFLYIDVLSPRAFSRPKGLPSFWPCVHPQSITPPRAHPDFSLRACVPLSVTPVGDRGTLPSKFIAR